MHDEVRIQFTRFSAFYSPLIATIAGGFLEAEELTPRYSVAPAGKSAIEGGSAPIASGGRANAHLAGPRSAAIPGRLKWPFVRAARPAASWSMPCSFTLRFAD